MIIENGTQRDTMTRKDYEDVYKHLDNLRADLPRWEYERYKFHFEMIFTLIHHKMQNN